MNQTHNPLPFPNPPIYTLNSGCGGWKGFGGVQGRGKGRGRRDEQRQKGLLYFPLHFAEARTMQGVFVFALHWEEIFATICVMNARRSSGGDAPTVDAHIWCVMRGQIICRHIWRCWYQSQLYWDKGFTMAVFCPGETLFTISGFSKWGRGFSE